MESHDSPEIPDRRETSDIPGFPSEDRKKKRKKDKSRKEHFPIRTRSVLAEAKNELSGVAATV